MTVKHWGGEAGIVRFNAHIPCSNAWDTMISYTALISTLGTMCGKGLANLVPNRIKKKVLPQVEVIIVDDERWNKIIENKIKLIDVAKEWMHGCVMENVWKIKIKLENIWIDLIRSIYAPYTVLLQCMAHRWVAVFEFTCISSAMAFFRSLLRCACPMCPSHLCKSDQSMTAKELVSTYSGF